MTFFGYIDPSSGSLFLQAMVGGVMAASYAGRKYIARSFDWAKGKLGRPGTGANESGQGTS